MMFFSQQFCNGALDSPLIVDDVKDGDVAMEVNEPSYIETHEKVVPLTRTFQSTLL